MLETSIAQYNASTTKRLEYYRTQQENYSITKNMYYNMALYNTTGKRPSPAEAAPPQTPPLFKP